MHRSEIIPSSSELKKMIPLCENEKHRIDEFRMIARNIITKQEKRIPVIVGPCSIHSVEGAIEYANRLKQLSQDISDHLFLVMRVYIEKPRTANGWKGLLYDPDLDGSNCLAKGLEISRSLLLNINKLGIPIATEFLNPLCAHYYEDLVTWGFIGARTTASQIHREYISSLNIPVGFKNDLIGDALPALHSMIASQSSHSFITVNDAGQICHFTSSGNPLTHLVLRGSDLKTNYDSKSIEEAAMLIEKFCMNPLIMVDCSHGNSYKNPEKQKEVFLEVVNHIESDVTDLGIMLESYLDEGNQPFNESGEHSPMLSVTDPCISWEDTEALIRWLDHSLTKNDKLLSVQ